MINFGKRDFIRMGENKEIILDRRVRHKDSLSNEDKRKGKREGSPNFRNKKKVQKTSDTERLYGNLTTTVESTKTN